MQKKTCLDAMGMNILVWKGNKTNMTFSVCKIRKGIPVKEEKEEDG